MTFCVPSFYWAQRKLVQNSLIFCLGLCSPSRVLLIYRLSMQRRIVWPLQQWNSHPVQVFTRCIDRYPSAIRSSRQNLLAAVYYSQATRNFLTYQMLLHSWGVSCCIELSAVTANSVFISNEATFFVTEIWAILPWCVQSKLCGLKLTSSQSISFPK